MMQVENLHSTAQRFRTYTVEQDLGYESPCWVWQRAVHAGGYPSVTVNKKSPIVLRLMYEALVGQIPDGLTLDHLCHSTHPTCRGECMHRRCINPFHAEPVTQAENARRATKAVCYKGHQKTYAPNGKWMRCKTCDAERARAYRASKRGMEPLPMPEIEGAAT